MSVVFAQISDCHLKAQPDALHYGANVYQNLLLALRKIKQDKNIEFLIFTGDLTQDHTAESYQLFNQAFLETQLVIPVYYLAGNHDDWAMLDEYLTAPCFNPAKTIELNTWQIHLLDSKSQTPAGYIAPSQLARIEVLDDKRFHFLLTHHHSVDVNYFIDRHGLENQTQLWQALDNKKHIKGMSCGHVHRAMELPLPSGFSHPFALYSCPATSVTFERDPDNLIALHHSVGYRTFTLTSQGNINTQVVELSGNKNKATM